MTWRSDCLAAIALAGATAIVPIQASATPPTAATAIYAGLTGEILLDNARVLVRRFVIRPGESTGIHWHHGHELLVVIKGGLLRSRDRGRVTLWKAGSVFWQDPFTASDEGSTNIGPTDVMLVWVTLKPVAPSAAGAPAVADPGSLYLGYPNVPGEDLLENEAVIVQRFVLQPGQWEGVHAHVPNMLYIFIHGSKWASRTYRQRRSAQGDSPDGSVGWMPTIGISEGHESGNLSATPQEVVWVTLKQ